jgi:hypothetical protein
MSKRPTSPLAIKIIRKFNERLEWAEKCINEKRLPIDKQPITIQSKSIEFFEGCINGAIAITATVLDEENCFHGFNYVDKQLNTIESPAMNHPDFRLWRVQFITK